MASPAPRSHSIHTAFLAILIIGLLCLLWSEWADTKFPVLDSDPLFFRTLWYSLPVGIPIIIFTLRFMFKPVRNRRTYWLFTPTIGAGTDTNLINRNMPQLIDVMHGGIWNGKSDLGTNPGGVIFNPCHVGSILVALDNL